MLLRLQRGRAKRKVDQIGPMLEGLHPGSRVLDLGCAEGYVGDEIGLRFGCDVTLCDVVDMNQTSRPLVLYDGLTLPFDDDAFDVCVLYFVLHHATEQEVVLGEAARVSKSIIIAESTYETPFDLRQLTFLDKLANRVRSGGKMTEQEEFLHFRTIPGWEAVFARLGLQVTRQDRLGRFIHQQVFFRLQQPADLSA